MRKAKPKLYHVEFSHKGAEILIIPASAEIKTIGDGLRVMQGQKLLAHFINATDFWELGTIARQPTTLGMSQAEIKKDLEVPFFKIVGPSQPLKPFGLSQPPTVDAKTYDMLIAKQLVNRTQAVGVCQADADFVDAAAYTMVKSKSVK